MQQLKLIIITPDEILVDEMVDQVSLPTTDGEITVLPGHVSLISALGSGDIVAKAKEEQIPMAVSGGFVKIHDNEVAIIADFALHVAHISPDIVEKAQARAHELELMRHNNEAVSFEHFEAELERSLTQVKIADKWRSKKYRI